MDRDFFERLRRHDEEKRTRTDEEVAILTEALSAGLTKATEPLVVTLIKLRVIVKDEFYTATLAAVLSGIIVATTKDFDEAGRLTERIRKNIEGLDKVNSSGPV